MQKTISGNATIHEKNKFGQLWQKRVEKLLIDNFDNPEVVIFI